MSSEREDTQKDVVRREKQKRCWFESIYTNPMPSLSILLSLVFFLFVAILGWAFFETHGLQKFVETERDRLTSDITVLRQDLQRIREDHKERIERQLADARKKIEDFTKEQQREMKDMVDDLASSVYSERINRYVVKLHGKDLGQRRVAIWRLLDILKEMENRGRGLFDSVVPEYGAIVPYLGFCPDKPADLDDTYRGRIWISVILLQSGNETIKEAFAAEIARNPNMTPRALEKLKVLVSGRSDREDFEKGITQLKPLLELLP